MAIPNEYAPWLRDIAERVDDLVAKPRAIDHFQLMFRDSIVELRKSNLRPFDEDTEGEEGPIIPHRPWRLTEKYAWLAAIHDKICDWSPRIIPWTGPNGNRNPNRAKCMIPFAVILSKVGELKDIYRPRIIGALRDAKADLLARGLLPSPPAPPAANECTLAEAANRWDVPKPVWTKAAKKQPNEAGYLATRRVGRTVLAQVPVAKHFAENYDARRELRQVGSKSEEGKAIVSALRNMKKTSGVKKRRKARSSNN